jgi:hypothetical protein
MRTLPSVFVLACLAMASPTATAAQSTGYADIEIQVGLEKFVLTPTAALIVHGVGGASSDGGAHDITAGESFSFRVGEVRVPSFMPLLSEEANEAWRAFSKDGVPHAIAFTYFVNCRSNSQLPSSLTPLCQIPLLERGLRFSILGNELGREVGTHFDRSRPERPDTMPVGQDGSMTVRKDGRAYWEGQLQDGPVAVMCNQRDINTRYECRHARALTPTTQYQVTFLLDGKDPPPSDAEWLSFSSAVEVFFRGFYKAASITPHPGQDGR